MNRFNKVYDSLNPKQKEAVNTIDGPLLVVAGPGTGKTQLLGARVANILRKTDVYPDNILCLTFTNKAADNMKQRLLDIIGSDAVSVVVNTFHGLAADVMNRHPEYFWHGARLLIAPDALQLEVMQRILSSLPPDHPLALKFAGQFTLVDDAAGAIKLAKEAGFTPDRLREIIKDNLKYINEIEPDFIELGQTRISPKTLPKIASLVEFLPKQSFATTTAALQSIQSVIQDSFQAGLEEAEKTGKTTPISRWKARWIQHVDDQYGLFNERRRNEWWLGVADAYEAYRGLLHSQGYYDFDDMLVEVISQIEKHADLKASLQEQFQYVLIDEFQDTNAAQIRLAHLIADHVDLPEPNIMAVGDDDQSIFKFQGAELSNMLRFTKDYKKAKRLVLTDNYRSTQSILDESAGIIAHAKYRLVNKLPNLAKDLRAAAAPSTKSNILHSSYRSREEQLVSTAKIAKDLLQKGNSVAILARRHSSLRDTAMILHQNHTPISYEQSNNILEQPVIEQLVLILKILVYLKRGEASRINELLSLTLRHPMWNIDGKKLWTFAVNQQKHYDWFLGLIESKDKKLKATGQWLEWLSGLSAKEPLAVIVEFVLGLRDNPDYKSPIKSYFLEQSAVTESRIEALSAVQLLRSLVSEFRMGKAAKVEDFVTFVEIMQVAGKPISDISPFVSGEKCVQLLTVHKAKGLEFDAVIVIDAVSSEWSPKNRGRLPPANLPLRPAEDDTDDYVRLMYVAATRAKHTLVINSYQYSDTGASVLAAVSLSRLPVTVMPAKTGKELVSVLKQSLAWPRLEQTDEKSILKPLLENYSINVSNLINFLDVTRGGPQYFKERNLLRLPSAKSPAASLGNAVHSALEEAQLLFNVRKFDFVTIINRFETSLLNEGLPEADYRQKLKEGRLILKNFVQKQNWQFSKGAKPEYRVADVHLGPARLSGKLDVLDNSGENTTISDYKTGRPQTSLNTKSGDAGVKAWRHRLQLIFYALLAELDPSIKIKGDLMCQMVYVEADSKSKQLLQYQPSDKDLQHLKLVLKAVWEHVQKLDFPDTSKYPADLAGITAFEQDLLDGKI